MIELAAILTAVIAPHLPQLMELGKTVGEALLKKGVDKGVDQGFETAKAVWDKLHPKIQAKEAAREAMDDAAANPDDADAQAALRVQIRKILEQDKPLADELKSLVEEKRPAGVTVTASGHRSVAIGCSVSGGSITTGDQFRPPISSQAEPSGD